MSTAVEITEQVLDDKLSRLEASRNWSPRVISKLETMIRTADDYGLFRINPLQFAEEKNVSESDAIDLLLHGAKLGLFEMEWHLVCAFCGSVVESFRHITHLHSHFLCNACSAENEAALDDYIQVSFTISPQVRELTYHHPESLAIEDYFFGYHLAKGVKVPQGAPSHRSALLNATKLMAYLAPAETKTVEFELLPGLLMARSVGLDMVLFVVTNGADHPSDQVIPLQLKDGQFKSDLPFGPQTIQAGPTTIRLGLAGEIPGGRVRVTVENQMNDTRPVWLLWYPSGTSPKSLEFEPFLSGKRLLTTQTFRDLFRSEVVQTTEGIGVKDITFLFTDLKGSTAMYDEIGDPKAFYLVRQHFDALGQAVTRNCGAVVKTIGDAVMATFMNPEDAVKAAIEMLRQIEEFNRGISQELILKIGIHRGHSIVVTLNDRLDYFGQTVNIASRVQGLADAGEIYITQDALDHLSESLLSGYDITPEKAVVKGVTGTLQVYKITARQ